MADQDKLNRRDFIASTTGVLAGATVYTQTTTQALADTPKPPVLDDQDPLVGFWRKPLYEAATVIPWNIAPELKEEPVRERHRIYCFLLMKLLRRFWNGNKRGPLGAYPWRVKQRAGGEPTDQYRGDMIEIPDRNRVNWDRYVGHNIACLAVDGNGEIIDFDFNHNEFFRSSAEHAETRLVKRLFSLTDIFDSWKTGHRNDNKSRGFSLDQVTLYTTLESCAQCSGVMSLARVKQVVYLQKDFGTYAIGNLMFNLAGLDKGAPKAPKPIPADAVDVEHFDRLNDEYTKFHTEISDENNPSRRPFYISPQKKSEFDPSITSFLCTDAALDIYEDGGRSLDSMVLNFPDAKYPGDEGVYDNRKCLDEARRFYEYADVEGYRGSPHKS